MREPADGGNEAVDSATRWELRNRCIPINAQITWNRFSGERSVSSDQDGRLSGR